MSYPTLKWNPPPVVRAPPVPIEAWEVHKEELCRLYKTMKLDDLMLFMREEHNFSPSRHQYATQFKRWDIHKYIKTKGGDSRPGNDTSGGTHLTESLPGTALTTTPASSLCAKFSSGLLPSDNMITPALHQSTESSSSSTMCLKRYAENNRLSVGSPKRRKARAESGSTRFGGSSQALSQSSNPRFHFVIKQSLPIALCIDAEDPVHLKVSLGNHDSNSSDEGDSASDTGEDSGEESSSPHRRHRPSCQQINPTRRMRIDDSGNSTKASAQTDLQNPFNTDDEEDSSDVVDVKFLHQITQEFPIDVERLLQVPQSEGPLGLDSSHVDSNAINPFADNTAEISDIPEYDDSIYVAQNTNTHTLPETLMHRARNSTFNAKKYDTTHLDNALFRPKSTDHLSDPYYEGLPVDPEDYWKSRTVSAEDEYAFNAGLQLEIRKCVPILCNGNEPKQQVSSCSLPDKVGHGLASDASQEQEKSFAATTNASVNTKISAVELLHYAQCGTNVNDFDESHLESIRQIANFMFGARCFEDAFVINLLVYKCSNSCADVSPQQVTRDLINIARSSTTRSQNEILRHLLSQALQLSQNTGEAARCRKFLLHSFLAATCRKQGDFPTALFHRTCALQNFDLNSHTSRPLPKEWRHAALVIYQQLNSLLQREGVLMSAETLVAKALCTGQDSDLGVNNIDLLRSILQWCKEALDGSVMDQGCWRNLESKYEHNRTIETTAIFCHLWQQWQIQPTNANLLRCNLRGHAGNLEKHLGISDSECLSTVATMIVDAYSSPLDVLQKNDDEFYERHLSIKAKDGLAKILQQSNADLAYVFGSTFIAQPPADTMLATPDTAAWEKLRRAYVQTFSAQNITLELPHLEYDISLLPPDDPISTTGFQQTPILFPGPPLNPSMRTASTGLASMKMLQERIRNNIVHTVDTLRVDLPSTAMHNNPAIDFDFEEVMGIAQRSLQSMSIGSEQVSQVVHEWESNFRTSIAPALANIVR